MTASADTPLRHNRSSPCPICGGFDEAPRGHGQRCFGFTAGDGSYAHCSREELAGPLPLEGGNTYAHRLGGPCRCGVTHVERPEPPRPKAGHTMTPKLPAPSAVYDYHRADGELAFQVLRYTLPDGEKTFRQRRPAPEGKREWHVPENLRVLYRLPELTQADARRPVFIVEGEKDADRLAELGLIATTNPGGAGKWLPKYCEHLRGRKVAILADSDPPDPHRGGARAGLEHARDVAAKLAGIAGEIRVVELPDVPERGDVSDWLDRHGNDRAALVQLVRAAPVWESSALGSGEISAAALQHLQIPELRYAVAELLPEGLCILAGAPKLGKSFLALNMAIAVAAGGKALGQLEVTPGAVLYLALEDGQQRLQRRMQQLVPTGDWPMKLMFRFDFPTIDQGGAEALGEWVDAHDDARLVIVDTLKRVRPQRKGNETAYNDDYNALQPLQELAKRRHVCIVVVHHTRKAASEDVFESVSGTYGLNGAADATLVLKRARGKDDATLDVTGRDVGEQSLGLRRDPAVGTWTYVGEAEEVQRSAARAIVLELLREVGKPATPKELSDMGAGEYTALKALLWKMKRDGEVAISGSGRYVPTRNADGSPYTPFTVYPFTYAREGVNETVESGGPTPGNGENRVNGKRSTRAGDPDTGKQVNEVNAVNAVNEGTRVNGVNDPSLEVCSVCGGELLKGVCWDCDDCRCELCGGWTGGALRARCDRCSVKAAIETQGEE